MVDRIRVHNWDKHQTYRRDRKQPPWVKIHRSLVFSPKWAALSDAQKGQIVSIWILAADRDGWIPSDPSVVKKLCGMDVEPDLNLFISLGLIEGGVKLASSWRQCDAPEAEAKAEAKGKGKKEERDAPPEIMEVTTDDGKRIQGLTRRFVQLRLENDPGAKIPGILMAWDAEMARIHIADKRPYDQIQEVIDHSMADEFWRVNILTPHDLRQKFPKLVLNLKRGTGKKSGFAGPDNRAERNREVMEKKLKEFDDAGDNQSIDGSGGDLQHALERGSSGRVSSDPERLSD